MSRVTIIPPTESLCPEKNVAAEWITTSAATAAPSSFVLSVSGCRSDGVRNVLSQITIAPAACASLATYAASERAFSCIT